MHQEQTQLIPWVSAKLSSLEALGGGPHSSRDVIKDVVTDDAKTPHDAVNITDVPPQLGLEPRKRKLPPLFSWYVENEMSRHNDSRRHYFIPHDLTRIVHTPLLAPCHCQRRSQEEKRVQAASKHPSLQEPEAGAQQSPAKAPPKKAGGKRKNFDDPRLAFHLQDHATFTKGGELVEHDIALGLKLDGLDKLWAKISSEELTQSLTIGAKDIQNELIRGEGTDKGAVSGVVQTAFTSSSFCTPRDRFSCRVCQAKGPASASCTFASLEEFSSHVVTQHLAPAHVFDIKHALVRLPLH